MAIIGQKGVIIEFSLWDRTLNVARAFRVANFGPIYGLVSAVPVVYYPQLIGPLTFANSISGEAFGQAVVGDTNAGVIRLGLTDEIEVFFNQRFVWQGRQFDVYVNATQDDTLVPPDDFTHVYKGKVTDISIDYVTGVVSISSTDFRQLLDQPYQPVTYGSGPEVPSTLKTKPLPKVRGAVRFIEPVLEDAASLIYRVNSGAIDSISQLLVGGVAFGMVTGTPGDGEWQPSYSTGQLTLGSDTAGLDVRALDVKSTDYATMTLANLMEDIITYHSAEVEAGVVDFVNATEPGLYGYYTNTEAKNTLDVLSDLMTGAGGWWSVNFNGKFTFGTFRIPNPLDTDFEFFHDDIVQFQLQKIVPPAKIIKLQHGRIWQPETTFADSIDDHTKQVYQSTGFPIRIYDDSPAFTQEPSALQPPIVDNMLFIEGSDDAVAVNVRNRLVMAFGEERRMYTFGTYKDITSLKIYDTVKVTYQTVKGYFRVLALTKSIDSGFSTLTVWGTPDPFNERGENGAVGEGNWHCFELAVPAEHSADELSVGFGAISRDGFYAVGTVNTDIANRVAIKWNLTDLTASLLTVGAGSVDTWDANASDRNGVRFAADFFDIDADQWKVFYYEGSGASRVSMHSGDSTGTGNTQKIIGMSPDGGSAVGYVRNVSDSNEAHACFWFLAPDADYHLLNRTGTASFANATSDNYDVIYGIDQSGINPHAVIWTLDAIDLDTNVETFLDEPVGATGSSANFGSHDGSTAVGYFRDGDGTHPCYWNGTDNVALEEYPDGDMDTPNQATGIDLSNFVICGNVTNEDGLVIASVWRNGVRETLSKLDDSEETDHCFAYAISDSGNLVVGVCAVEGIYKPVVWKFY